MCQLSWNLAESKDYILCYHRYRIDSIEVSPSPLASPQPNSEGNQSKSVKTSTRGTQNQISTSSFVRWSSQLNILIITLLIIIILF